MGTFGGLYRAARSKQWGWFWAVLLTWLVGFGWLVGWVYLLGPSRRESLGRQTVPDGGCHDGIAPASWWTRAKAAVIDALLFFGALLSPVLLVVGAFVAAWDEAAEEFSFTGGSVGLLVVGIISGVGVFVWGGWLFGYRQGVPGNTPGTRRLRIRLVDVDSGEAPGGAKGVGRWLVPCLVGGIQGIGNILQLIDILWPLWDSKNQRLIDKVFKTRVVVGATATQSTDDWMPSSPIS